MPPRAGWFPSTDGGLPSPVAGLETIEGVGLVAKCVENFWLSPACRSDVSSCILTVTAGSGGDTVPLSWDDFGGKQILGWLGVTSLTKVGGFLRRLGNARHHAVGHDLCHASCLGSDQDLQ